LQEKIYDRDPRLGECFEKSVELIGYEAGVLSWMSCADEECKKQLRTYWSVIRHFVQEIFGIDVRIESVPCSRDEEPSEEGKKKTDEPRPIAAEDEGYSSMIESVELGDAGSCMQNSTGLGDATKEYNGADILEEPFVKKAIELFDARRIKIRPKI
jgi:DNA polymerase-3 subunit gamma/tau